MDIVNFPFSRFQSDEPLRPWLPVTIKNPQSNPSATFNTIGLIDTGADECAIPASYASLLGHDLLAGKTKTINTGNGPSTAYSHTVCFDIAGIKIENVRIDFMPNLFFVLLGVRSFLSNYILTVDYRKKVFSLTNS